MAVAAASDHLKKCSPSFKSVTANTCGSTACRYIASMALYGISILFVALVLAASLANYHFGANLSTFLLCKWTCLACKY